MIINDVYIHLLRVNWVTRILGSPRPSNIPFIFPLMPSEFLKVYVKSIELYLDSINLPKNELVCLHGLLGALLLALEDFVDHGMHFPINKQGVQIVIPMGVAWVCYPDDWILDQILVNHLRNLRRGVMKDLRYRLMGAGRSWLQ